MKYVKIPTEDMELITCLIDVMKTIAPAQYRQQADEAYQKLHNGKFEIIEDE